MEILNQIQHYGFWFLVVLTVLVFIHELGHFAVARWCGVRVEVFSIGFGPELVGFTDRTGTRWKLSWLPLGGYVRMFGQEENAIEGQAARPLTDAERAVSFKEKTVGQRMAIVFAGPAANYLFAFAIFTALYAISGKPVIPPIVGKVFAESPAARAGIVPGDTIVRVDGTEIESFYDIQYVVQSSLGKMLTHRSYARRGARQGSRDRQGDHLRRPRLWARRLCEERHQGSLRGRILGRRRQ
jgi:regulator of sigma E protease